MINELKKEEADCGLQTQLAAWRRILNNLPPLEASN
jgi:hypothetical protein